MIKLAPAWCVCVSVCVWVGGIQPSNLFQGWSEGVMCFHDHGVLGHGGRCHSIHDRWRGYDLRRGLCLSCSPVLSLIHVLFVFLSFFLHLFLSFFHSLQFFFSIFIFLYLSPLFLTPQPPTSWLTHLSVPCSLSLCLSIRLVFTLMSLVKWSDPSDRLVLFIKPMLQCKFMPWGIHL